LSGVVDFKGATPFTATLLPGVQTLFAFSGALVAFSVDNSDKVDYDSSLDSELSGRGTSTLVVGAITTTTTLTSSLSNSVFGQSVTFTATVASSAGIPAGLVSFLLDGSTTLGTAALNSSGQAAITTSALSVGTHTIAAVYSRNANFLASTSPALLQTVLSAQQELALIIKQVTGMVTNGILNGGNGNALIVKLNNAINSLDKGNTISGVNQMDAFLNQTNAFLKSGKLDSTDALTLISEMDEAIAAALASPI
jgi:Bacterial Ig-like domain (group 3)